jgi:hypothetical protein
LRDGETAVMPAGGESVVVDIEGLLQLQW